jgi:hypothetical protein
MARERCPYCSAGCAMCGGSGFQQVPVRGRRNDAKNYEPHRPLSDTEEEEGSPPVEDESRPEA